MRRKCAFCGNVRKVCIQSIVLDGKTFCSIACAWNYFHLRPLAEIACARCGAIIRMNAIVHRSWKTTPDEYFCCEKCMMDYLGLKIMEDKKNDD